MSNDFAQRLQQIFHDQILSGKSLNRFNIEETMDALLKREDVNLSRAERDQLTNRFVEELLGLGPLEPIVQDPRVMEIMVNRYDEVYVERGGKLEKTDVTFDSEEHLLQIIDNIVTPLGFVVNESNPIVDARLADGSRVNVVIRPIALNGAAMTIRKFPARELTLDQLIQFGSLSEEMATFLDACIKARLNIIVAGGTGSGKTTILNKLMDFIPEDDRIVTVETAGELRFSNPHAIRLETRPPNIEGKGEVSMHDLVVNSMKMRPDRIVVAELHGGEVIDVLQAMNTGYDGSMATIHANSVRDTIARLEVMATMSGLEVPILSIREQLASAIDVIVHQQRLRDGSRKILKITEVVGMQNNFITMQDIFEFEQTDFQDNKIIGQFKPTGIVPNFTDTIRESGIDMPDEFFNPEV